MVEYMIIDISTSYDYCKAGPQQLEHVIRDIKKLTSFKIIEAIRNRLPRKAGESC